MMTYEVLSKLKSDEVAEIATTDKLILALGEASLRKNIKNKLRRGNYASTKMRLVRESIA